MFGVKKKTEVIGSPSFIEVCNEEGKVIGYTKRIKFGEDGRTGRMIGTDENGNWVFNDFCADCGVEKGRFHWVDCDQEQTPAGSQMTKIHISRRMYKNRIGDENALSLGEVKNVRKED